MDLSTALVQSLKFGLSLWNTKESRKYLDRVIFLEKKILYEKNKPEKNRNHAVIDNCNAELCIISESTAKFGKQDA